jgi:hypothetical protein
VTEPLPDRCPQCLCDDCGGTLADHAGATCQCRDCIDYPDYACTTFTRPGRIGFISQQLGPLLSTHLGPKQQRRCDAVAHAAHHALLDYDHPEERQP